jgi:hypothetical protein
MASILVKSDYLENDTEQRTVYGKEEKKQGT